MNQDSQNAPHLTDVVPELVAELQQLLTEQGEHTIAKQVAGLAIVERCKCGDSFCASFYTASRPPGRFRQGHRTISLSPRRGILNVDVVGFDIVQVEVLYRDEIKNKVAAAVP